MEKQAKLEEIAFELGEKEKKLQYFELKLEKKEEELRIKEENLYPRIKISKTSGRSEEFFFDQEEKSPYRA